MNAVDWSVGTGPGRNRRRTLLVAVGLFVCSATFFAVVPRFDPVVRILRVEHLAIGLFVASALVAAGGLGLRRTWVSVFALAAGFGVHLGGIGITGDLPGPLFRAAWAGVVGIVVASTLGVLGGSLGLGLRRLWARGSGGQ